MENQEKKDEFSERINEFIKEVQDAGERLNTDIAAKMKKMKSAAGKWQDEMKDSEKWKEVSEGIKRVGSEIERTVKIAFTSQKKEEK